MAGDATRILGFQEEAKAAHLDLARLCAAVAQAQRKRRESPSPEFPLPEIIWALQHGYGDTAIQLITAAQTCQEAAASEEMYRQRALHERAVAATDTPHYMEDAEEGLPLIACYHTSGAEPDGV